MIRPIYAGQHGPAVIMMDLVVIVLLAILTVVVAFTLQRRSSKTALSSKLIPGWDKKPADLETGDLEIALSTGSLGEFLIQKHKGGKCPVTSFWWRDRRVVSVCTQRAFKETAHIYDRPRHIFGPCFEPLHGAWSIQSLNGKEWKERKNLLHKTVRGENLEEFFSDIVQVAQERAQVWPTGTNVALMTEMFQMSLKSIVFTSFGNIFEDNSGLEQLASLYHICKLEMDKRILDVPSSASAREMDFQNSLKDLQGILKEMIRVRREDGGGKPLPLLDALLESSGPEERILSDMTTFLGGFHTATYYATWVFFFLAQHRDIQEKVLEEARQKVGSCCGEKLKAYALSSSTYLRQVLDEALRVSTTVPFSAHLSNEDTVIDGYCVPANTPIVHAICVSLKDEAVWKNPEKFDPDRFAPGTQHSKRGHEFRPFGIPHIRRCPANQFVYFMVSIFVVIFLQRFVLLVDATNDPQKKYGIATSPKENLLIKVEFRENHENTH